MCVCACTWMTQEQRGRERQLELDQSKTMNKNSIQVSCMIGMGSSIGAFISYLPGWLRRKLRQQLSGWDLNQHSSMACRHCEWLHRLLYHSIPPLGVNLQKPSLNNDSDPHTFSTLFSLALFQQTSYVCFSIQIRKYIVSLSDNVYRYGSLRWGGHHFGGESK